jgi:hypothetical protein
VDNGIIVENPEGGSTCIQRVADADIATPAKTQILPVRIRVMGKVQEANQAAMASALPSVDPLSTIQIRPGVSLSSLSARKQRRVSARLFQLMRIMWAFCALRLGLVKFVGIRQIGVCCRVLLLAEDYATVRSALPEKAWYDVVVLKRDGAY